MDAHEFDRDLDDFNHLYNAVVLFGDEDVTRTAEHLRRLYFRAYEAGAAAYERSGSWADLVEEFGASFRAQKDDIGEARVALLRAMKQDLALRAPRPS